MACPTPPLDLPLHSDLRILAQCGRDFLRQAHQKATHSRRLPICRRSQGRHQPLRPGNQCRTKTLHLDRRSQPRPRRCQTRETSVRVDPLVAAQHGKRPLIAAIHDYEAAMLDYGFTAVRNSLKAMQQTTGQGPIAMALSRAVLRAIDLTPPLKRAMARGLGEE